MDGEFYICFTCQIPIKADKQPTQALKELFGYLDFLQQLTRQSSRAGEVTVVGKGNIAATRHNEDCTTTTRQTSHTNTY